MSMRSQKGRRLADSKQARQSEAWKETPLYDPGFFCAAEDSLLKTRAKAR